MDLHKAMTLFQRVADSGSLTAAAADVGLSPTMVGNHIRALEGHLGAKLFNRTTRQQNLTEFGRLYYDRAAEILALVEDTRSLAQDTQAVPRGRLRVSVTPLFAYGLLIPLLPNYAARFPEVEIDLSLSDVAVDLIAERFDAAVRVGPLVESEMIARPLRPYRLMLAASPGYLAERGRPEDPRELCRHRCLAFAYPARSQWRRSGPVWELSGPKGKTEVPIKAYLTSESAMGLYRAAVAGLGIAMLPDFLIEQDLARGILCEVMPNWAPPRREANLLYLRDRRMTLKLRSFVDFVMENLGAGASAQTER